MITLDLRKQYKSLYDPKPGTVAMVDVPELSFLMIDGRIEAGGEPGTSPGFAAAVGALYGLAYTLKFTAKRRAVDGVDYPVMALEGLWWVEGEAFALDKDWRAFSDRWSYRLMILQPDLVTAEMVEEARREAARKRPSAELERLRLERFREGLCVQALHLGPYSTEPATVARMQAYAAEQGYRLAGLHHEVYLGDPRRSAPEKLKTVLRQGVEKVVGAG